MKLVSKNNLLICLLSSTLSITFLMPSGYAMEPAEDDRKVIPLSQTLFSDLETLPDDPFSHAYCVKLKPYPLALIHKRKKKA